MGFGFGFGFGLAVRARVARGGGRADDAVAMQQFELGAQPAVARHLQLHEAVRLQPRDVRVGDADAASCRGARRGRRAQSGLEVHPSEHHAPQIGLVRNRLRVRARVRVTSVCFHFCR